VVASATLPADQCSWGGDAAWLSGAATTTTYSSSNSSISGWIAAADAGDVECVLPEEYVLGPSSTLASPEAAAAAVRLDTGSCAGAEAVWDVEQAYDHQQQQAVQWEQHQAYLQRLHQRLRPSAAGTAQAAGGSWHWRSQLQQQQQQQQQQHGGVAAGGVPSYRLAPAVLPVEQLLEQWGAMQQQLQQGVSSRQAPAASAAPAAAALSGAVQQPPPATAAAVAVAVAAAAPGMASKSGGGGRGITDGLIRGIVGPGAQLSALRRLDLSLEQLGSTSGLAALCPHLEVRLGGGGGQKGAWGRGEGVERRGPGGGGRGEVSAHPLLPARHMQGYTSGVRVVPAAAWC
jgi:hypothetical protein